MTTVYLIRHSKPLKVNNDFNKDPLQLRNEKEVLSVEGEEIAQNHFAHDEFQDIDFIFSSNSLAILEIKQLPPLARPYCISIINFFAGLLTPLAIFSEKFKISLFIS